MTRVNPPILIGITRSARFLVSMTWVLAVWLVTTSGVVLAEQSLIDRARASGERLEKLSEENNNLRSDLNVLAAEIDADARKAAILLNDKCGVDAGVALEELPRLQIVPIPAISLSVEEEAAIREVLGEVPGGIPPLDQADYFTVALAGSLASAYDLFLVKTPGTSIATKKVKEFTLKLHEDYLSKLERLFKVPFDSIPSGTGHRGKSLGHDPFLGLVFGVYDIMNGRSTYVEKGKIVSVPVKGFKTSNVDEAMIRWMGHMLSDIGTKHGLPLPGWNLLQLAEFGKFGDKERTVADVARQMYNKGYDLRHYAAGAGSPAIVEVLIRTYHYMGLALKVQPQFDEPVDELIWNAQNEARLSAMLFYAHAIASGVNAGKVVFNGWRPPYINGLLSINIAQWQMFGVSTIGFVRSRNRDVTVEHIRRNYYLLKDQWGSFPTIEIKMTNDTEPLP